MFETWKTVEIAGQRQVDPVITESAQQTQPSEYPGAETQETAAGFNTVFQKSQWGEKPAARGKHNKPWARGFSPSEPPLAQHPEETEFQQGQQAASFTPLLSHSCY